MAALNRRSELFLGAEAAHSSPADPQHSTTVIVTYSFHSTLESLKLFLCTRETVSLVKHLLCKPDTPKPLKGGQKNKLQEVSLPAPHTAPHTNIHAWNNNNNTNFKVHPY